DGGSQGEAQTIAGPRPSPQPDSGSRPTYPDRMPPELRPTALAELVELSERPRVDDWSLRAALVRYAQPEPVRVSQVMELVRRIEAALQPHMKLLAERGEELWAAVES